MPTNPFTAAERVAERRAQETMMDIARVQQVADNAAHGVIVSVVGVEGSQTPFAARVTAPVIGEIGLPKRDDLVLVAYAGGRTPLVIGAVPTEENALPAYVSGERRVANQSGSATLTLGAGGTITLSANGARWPHRASDPSPTDVDDGTTWYNTTDDAFRGVEGGSVVTFSTS
jgi:hypothetical protein